MNDKELVSRPRVKHPFLPCEFCGAMGSREGTVCIKCDNEMIRVEKEFHAQQKAPHPTRKCRLCLGPVTATRYFACEICIPSYESEDMFQDTMECDPLGEEPLGSFEAAEKRLKLQARQSKKCSTCKERFSIEAFGRDVHKPDGKADSCKSCKTAYYRRWAASKKEARNG